MLKQMRGFARSWFARAFLIILGILMSVTVTQNRSQIMAMFSSITGPRGLADVGGRDIMPYQVTRSFDQFLRQQREQGQNVTREEAIAQNVHRALLEQLIERAAMHSYAEKLGIHADPSQVAEAIRQIPGVRGGVAGGFDETSFDRLLQENGYSRGEFLQQARDDIAAGMVIRAMTAGVHAPASYGAAVLAFQSETRTISIAEAPLTLIGNLPPPTPEQLQAFYRENADNLRLPEYRALTLVYARLSDFAARANVPEDRVRQEFDSRRASLTRPETRTFVRFAATSEAQARDIVQRLSRGETPQAISAATHAQAVTQTDQRRDQISEQAIGDAVFSMAPSAPARAVQARLTPWAVVKVTGVTAGTEPSYAEARQGIHDELARADATDAMEAAVSAFEEARAGGTAIAQAARANNLTIVNVPAVDQRGATPEGQPVAGLVDQAELLRLAFQTGEGEASDFTQAGDADVVVAVDHITPPAVRPLDQVRPQLIQAWTAREAARRFTDLGARVTTAASHGNFADAVRANRLAMRATSQQLSRQAAAQLPPAFAAQIFSARPGDVVTAMRPDGRGLLVAKVEAVTRANPTEQRAVVEQLRTRMQQSLGQGLVEAISKQVVAQGNPRRNETLITQTFAVRTEEQQQQ